MANKLTLIDLAKRSGNDAQVGIVESLTQSNALLSLLPTRSITGVSFKYAQRSALPSVSFRGYNQGVTPSRSVIKQITVECKIISGRSEVDKLIAEADPRTVEQVRAEEDAGFIAVLGNTYNSKAFYGDSTAEELEFDGVAKTLNATSFSNCISAGGAGGSCSSIYAFSFRDAVTPQGRMRGVEMPLANGKNITAIDMGLQYAADADDRKFLAYTTEFEFQPTLAVYDTRSVGRICNIKSGSKPTVSHFNQLITAMHPFVPDVFLCNKAVYNYVQELKGTTFTSDKPYESSELFKRALFFDGIPIMIDENITSTEATVS